MFRDGRERIVVDLRAGDDRDGVVEQVDELAEHPRLGLAAQAQEQHVVLGEDRVLDLGDDRLLVAEDIGKQAARRPASLAIRFRRISSLTDSIR